MKLKDIVPKFKEKYKINAPPGTLAGFYNTEMKEKFSKMAVDRVHVTDTRINPKQRPDVLVDLEMILARRCNAVGRTGIPYIWKIAQMLAIHIFNKLVATKIYNTKGQRKEQDKPLPEELISNVEQSRLVAKYMAKSSVKTEYHKSMDAAKNVTTDPKNSCTHCDRKFKDNINFTLHCYYHSCRDNLALSIVDEEEVQVEEEGLSDEEDDVSTISVFRFKASPGWLTNFMTRHDVAFLKMKGEKGSADYEAVDEWVVKWITTFNDVWLKKHPKTFRQAV